MKKSSTGAGILGRARSAVLAGIAGTAMLASAVILAPVSSALADPNPPATATPVHAQGKRLEKLFKREQAVLGTEQKQLDRASELGKKIQDRIDKLKKEGKDTSKLEAALAHLNTAIASAQSFHNAAKSILDTHAGFDASGQVVDAAKARETVATAGKAERDFYKTMRKSIRELRPDRKEVRNENKNKQPATRSKSPAKKSQSLGNDR